MPQGVVELKKNCKRAKYNNFLLLQIIRM